jgi:hypothetical protein
MNDQELEQIETVDVDVTVESMDAHVMCLRDNGYKVIKKYSVWGRNFLFFLLGAYLMGVFYAQ